MFSPEPKKYAFRHPLTAMEGGFVDVTRGLSPQYILLAYRWGIFPWINENGYFLWFFLDPRLVLYPRNLHVAKSMRPYLNQEKFTISYDTAFKEVMTACMKVKRKNDTETWIDAAFLHAYTELHEMGYAHSVEVWKDTALVGGLYGLAIGKVFYGESMFSLESNASKFGFIKLVQLLTDKGFQLVDCQQDTPHLRSLGAELIGGKTFLSSLRQNMLLPDDAGKWLNENS